MKIVAYSNGKQLLPCIVTSLEINKTGLQIFKRLVIIFIGLFDSAAYKHKRKYFIGHVQCRGKEGIMLRLDLVLLYGVQ